MYIRLRVCFRVYDQNALFPIPHPTPPLTRIMPFPHLLPLAGAAVKQYTVNLNGDMSKWGQDKIKQVARDAFERGKKHKRMHA